MTWFKLSLNWNCHTVNISEYQWINIFKYTYDNVIELYSSLYLTSILRCAQDHAFMVYTNVIAILHLFWMYLKWRLRSKRKVLERKVSPAPFHAWRQNLECRQMNDIVQNRTIRSEKICKKIVIMVCWKLKHAEVMKVVKWIIMSCICRKERVFPCGLLEMKGDEIKK